MPLNYKSNEYRIEKITKKKNYIICIKLSLFTYFSLKIK